MQPHATDDSLMSRFDEHGLRRFRARDAIWSPSARLRCCSCVFGGRLGRGGPGEQMDPGIGRDVVLAVGKPAGWIADALPFAQLAARRDGVAVARRRASTAAARFATRSRCRPTRRCRRSPPTRSTRPQLGEKPPPRRPLQHAAGHRRLDVDAA